MAIIINLIYSGQWTQWITKILNLTVSTIYLVTKLGLSSISSFFFFFFFVFCLFRAAPMAYWGSQARGLISCSCRPKPEPQQHGIWATSAIYTTAHGNAGSPAHWGRPGIEPTTSDSLTTEPRQELQFLVLVNLLSSFPYGTLSIAPE